jgi:hypothetical protein
MVLIIIFTLSIMPGIFNAEILNLTLTRNLDKPDTEVDLLWTSVPGAISYKIYRGTTEEELELVHTINISQTLYPTRYTDMGRKPETTYYYRVTAQNNQSVDIDLEESSITTGAIPKPVIISSKFNINPDIYGNNEITLVWDKVSDAATGAYIRRDGLEGILVSIDDVSQFETVSSITYKATDTIIDFDTAYEYNIMSYDTDGHLSDASDNYPVYPIEVPIISVSLTNGIATIDTGDYPDIELFSLERSKYSDGLWSDWELIKEEIAAGSEFINDVISSGGVYRYRLKARPDTEYTGFSNITEPISSPIAPTGISAVMINQNLISITWVNSQDNISSLRIERKQGEGGTFTTVGTVNDPDLSVFDDWGTFNANTTYFYRIVAVGDDTNSSVSETVSVTTNTPEAPANLELKVIDANKVTLTWDDNSNNESLFIIERKTDTGEFVELDNQVAANTVTYTDTGLSSTSVYAYRVYAYNYLGDSEYTNEVLISLQNLKPPVTLDVDPVNASSIRVAWDYAGDNVLSTVIERKTGEDGEWGEIITLSNSVEQYTNTGLSSNTQYYYRVRSVSNGNVFSLSYPNNETGIGGLSRLNPVHLNAQVSSTNQVTLSWTGDAQGSNIAIERSSKTEGFEPVATISSSLDTYYDTGLIINERYTYRVKVVGENNESDYSNSVEVVNSYLEEPSNLEAYVTQEKGLELTWIDNSFDETGFEIWRRTTNTSWRVHTTVGRNATFYVDNTAEEGIQYYYMVRAYNNVYNVYSKNTSEVSAGIGLINPPENLDYTVISSSKIKLTWEDTSEDETGFIIERKIGEAGTYENIGSASKNATAYEVAGLNSYLIYYFRIKAYNPGITADSFSNELMVSLKMPNTPAITELKSISDSTVIIKWDDNSENEDGYIIFRARENSGTYIKVADLDKNSTKYTDDNLSSDTNYTYKIRAYNKSGYKTSMSKSIKTKERVYFDDMSPSHWSWDSVMELTSRGIFKGKPGNIFAPDDIITRAEFNAILIRTFDIDATPAGTLNDVKPGTWYYEEVMKGYINGIAETDDNGNFRPNEPITREEIAKMLVETLKVIKKPLRSYQNSVLEKFRDKDQISPDAISSMASMVGEGLILGRTNTTIVPQGNATRAEAATLIHRVLNKIE